MVPIVLPVPEVLPRLEGELGKLQEQAARAPESGKARIHRDAVQPRRGAPPGASLTPAPAGAP